VICRAVIGRVDDPAIERAGIDWVDVGWQQTLRRALRLVSQGGRRVDVLLPPGGRLSHGDVLAAGPPVVAVRLATIAVLCIHAGDPVTLGRIAFDLGNRHVPVQITPDGLLTPDDGPARGVAASHGLACETIESRFYPEPVTLDDPPPRF
jgi:urease accessory protein